MPRTADRLILLVVVFALTLAASAQVPSNAPTWLPDDYRYDAPFVAGATYDPAVPTPHAVLGFEVGDRPMTHAQIRQCLEAWSAHPRMKLVTFGHTHERRALCYAVVTSESNHRRLDEIRAAIGRLADPRRLRDDAEAQTLIRDTPAIAWLAYCIHGDELSGADAAVAVVYHLLACTDDDVKRQLDQAVLVIDPLMNPDGRDRFIRMIDECNGYTPNLDSDAVQHAGRWPRGRTNHYFFDMNRDWIYATQPETRARQREIVAWNPQLLVDGHEMGPDASFLTNPAREPFHQGLAPSIRNWWVVFADASGAAFDGHGWSYYTREWADFWYPGYTDGWATNLGAIGILYEQARTGGRAIRVSTGKTLTYREAVHHQFVATMAHVATLAQHRQAILRDFTAIKRAALTGALLAADPGHGAGLPESDARRAHRLTEAARPPQTFLLPPAANTSRRRDFLEYLANQGIEVGVASEPFRATVVSTLRESSESREFPAGTIVVHRAQPLGPLVGAVLDFDPRLDKAFLDSERKELETRRSSRLYDITGWSPPLAWGLDAYWSAEPVNVRTAPYRTSAGAQPASGAAVASMPTDENPYAYLFDAQDDSVMRATAHLLQAGVVCRVADKDVRVGDRTFARGSILIRRHENKPDVAQRVRQAAEFAGAEVFAARTARSADDTPDLGGEHLLLLTPPRVALVGDGGGDSSTYGAIWHLLDCEIGLAVSLVDTEMRGIDLRRFNVVIVAAPASVRNRADELAVWIRAGGTLIAIEGAAGALADEKLKLSAVRRREDVLKQLDEYASAAALERSAGQTDVDVDKLFDDFVENVPPGEKIEKPETKLTDEALDEWRQVFAATGVIVRAELHREHWLTFGVGLPPAKLPSVPSTATAPASAAAPATTQPPVRLPLSFRVFDPEGPLAELPVFVQGPTVLLSKPPVQTPVRFAPARTLRLSGLLWPEAAVRLGGSAAVTVESIGRGQLILMAQDPVFRGAWRGSRRLLMNAILLGPGCGASPPAP